MHSTVLIFIDHAEGKMRLIASACLSVPPEVSVYVAAHKGILRRPGGWTDDRCYQTLLPSFAVNKYFLVDV